MKVAAAYDCATVSWPEYCRRVYKLNGKNLFELHGSPTDRHAQKWNQLEEIERLLVVRSTLRLTSATRSSRWKSWPGWPA
jgi:hypothetical protein